MMPIRIVDVGGEPLAGFGVDIYQCTPGADEELVASLTTTRYGLIRLSAPSGLYAMRFTVGGAVQRSSFYVHPDEVGGMTVRLTKSRDRLELGFNR